MEKLIRRYNMVNNIKNKNTKCFVNFDIVSFYPSIKDEHLIKAINFARLYTKIEERNINLIKHTRITIIIYNIKNCLPF